MLRGFVDEISADRGAGLGPGRSPIWRRPVKVDDRWSTASTYASPAPTCRGRTCSTSSATGNHAFVFEFNPPLPLIRDHHIQVRYSGTDADCAEGRSHAAAQSPFIAERLLQPILVTAPGRAGSTLLMQKLAAHPLVSVANLYPFETELLKYYSHAFGILTAPGDHERSGKPESFVDNHRFLGANPYYVPPLPRRSQTPVASTQFYRDDVPRELAGRVPQDHQWVLHQPGGGPGEAGCDCSSPRNASWPAWRAGSRAACSPARGRSSWCAIRATFCAPTNRSGRMQRRSDPAAEAVRRRLDGYPQGAAAGRAVRAV